MPAPAYAAVTSTQSGAIIRAWTEGRNLRWDDWQTNLNSPALFLDIAARDDGDDEPEAIAVWQDHETDDCLALFEGSDRPFRLGKCHGTMCVAARLHPETKLFHVWWLEQVVVDGQKTCQQIGHWIEGQGSTFQDLPAHLVGTSQGIRDVEFRDGLWFVHYMDDERARFV